LECIKRYYIFLSDFTQVLRAIQFKDFSVCVSDHVNRGLLGKIFFPDNLDFWKILGKIANYALLGSAISFSLGIIDSLKPENIL